jgi:hydroxyquinol 1,2-dioxygenase
MIIEREQDITRAVLAELEGATDPRFREIMAAAVRHLHDFAREVRLTEAEFRQACGVIAQLGQHTTASHNEVVLAAGSLGLSSLVCLLNNGSQGQSETTANLMGPFWRADAPRVAMDGSIVRTASREPPLFVTAWVRDVHGQPVADADVDVWQASTDGWYENEDPTQADMNLRGKLRSDAQGCVRYRTIKPAGYPIPLNGPVGALLRAQGRHNMRPAHLHFMIHKPGFKTQFSQVYASDDPHLDSDVQFGVTRALIGQFVRHDSGPAPAGDVTGPWYTLAHSFVIEAGEASLPKPPITGKHEGPAPARARLVRRS